MAQDHGRRPGRLGDGCIPLFDPDSEGHAKIERMYAYARQDGRDPANIGIQGDMTIGAGDPHDWVNKEFAAWTDMGATHFSVNAIDSDMSSPKDHINSTRRFKEAVDGL